MRIPRKRPVANKNSTAAVSDMDGEVPSLRLSPDLSLGNRCSFVFVQLLNPGSGEVYDVSNE